MSATCPETTACVRERRVHATMSGAGSSSEPLNADKHEEARIEKVRALHDDIIKRTIAGLLPDVKADGLDTEVLNELKRVRAPHCVPRPARSRPFPLRCNPFAARRDGRPSWRPLAHTYRTTPTRRTEALGASRRRQAAACV